MVPGPAALRLPLILVLVASVACTGSRAGEPATSADPRPAELVLVETGEDILGIASDSGDIRLRVRGGHLSGDLSDAVALAGGEAISTTDISSAASERWKARVPDGFEVGVVSFDGSSVALTQGPAGSLYTPGGRARTQILVADEGNPKLRRYELRGNFVPEAFSLDGRSLYLIEHVPAADPKRYGVRNLVLRTGRVFRVGGRLKQPAPASMRGTGRMQVWHPEGDALYTLYTKQRPNDAHDVLSDDHAADPHRAGPVNAFVHVLSLDASWAHCIDLPAPFGLGDAASHGLAITPGGLTMYVADPSHGVVARVDTSRLRVEETAVADLGAPTGRAMPAAVGSDRRLYLGTSEGVAVLDGDTLEVLGRWIVRDVTALAVSADGSVVYAGTPGGIEVRDAITGEVLERLASTDGQALHVVAAE